MQTKNFTVPNISCGHCTMRIEKTLNALDGVASVKAEIPTKAVTVEWDESQTGWDDIKVALEKIGYPPEE
jgi:copper chaperone